MTLTDETFFSNDDYRKLTAAQKDRLRELHQNKRNRRQANIHTQSSVDDTVSSTASTLRISNANQAPTPTPTVVTSSDNGSHLRQVLSQTQNRPATSNDQRDSAPLQISYQGRTYSQMHTNLTYSISQHHSQTHTGSLLDGGANGGMSGDDVRVIAETMDCADVTGIADNTSRL